MTDGKSHTYWQTSNAEKCESHYILIQLKENIKLTSISLQSIGTKTDELANHEVELIDFVLSKVDFANKQVLQQSIDTAVEAFEMIIEGDDIQRIQERVNRKK